MLYSNISKLHESSHTHTHTYTHTHTRTHIRIYIYYIYMYMCIIYYICIMYIYYIYMYICIYIQTYIHYMYIHIYISIYICIDTLINLFISKCNQHALSNDKRAQSLSRFWELCWIFGDTYLAADISCSTISFWSKEK